MRTKGILRIDMRRDAWSALVSSKVLLPIGGIVTLGALAGLVINSYYSVRNYADPLYHISQRILVQPVQLWAATWQEVSFNLGRGVDYQAVDYVFVSSPYTATNSAIRFLMERELGYFRSHELIVAGQQYAGGYPEIFFVLFGFTWSLLLMLVMGVAAAFLLYLAMRSLVKGKLLTSLMAVYLYYGFAVGYLGGMLNFILTPTYWVKVLVLVICSIGEHYILQRGRRQFVLAPVAPSPFPQEFFR